MNCYVATDLEGTLSGGEAWKGVAAYLKAHGRGRDHQVFFAMHFVPALLARGGILDKHAFRMQWLQDQAKLLRGYTRVELDAIADWIVDKELWAKRRAAVIEELKRHHDAGCAIIVASGAYEPIAQALARRMELQNLRVLATPLEMVNDRATGNLTGQVGVDAVKAQRLREVVGDGRLIAAYGDTAADAAMLEMSETPVAVAPDAALLKIANEKGWRVME